MGQCWLGLCEIDSVVCDLVMVAIKRLIKEGAYLRIKDYRNIYYELVTWFYTTIYIFNSNYKKVINRYR